MTIQEILAQANVSDIIQSLTKHPRGVPKWSDLSKDYDHQQHSVITDQTSLKDKVRKDGSVEKSARIAIPIEKLAASRMSAFCCAIPVKRRYKGVESDTHQEIVSAIELIYQSVHIDSVNLQRIEDYFASCQSATLWYVVERPTHLYGFDSKYKLKCKTYSPKEGHTIYPLFDETDDLIALSFGYKVEVDGKDQNAIETYTADRRLRWIAGDGGWVLEADESIMLGKIPAVYMQRKGAIYSDIISMRHEWEYTLSRNSNVISYNSAPILKVKGNLMGEEGKGDGRRIWKVNENGDVGYVSWDQSVESINFHTQQMRQLIFSTLQLPDLSFENMKSLGAIGYDARQMLLSDAHLKVNRESGSIIEMLEREASVIKAFLALMNTSWATALEDITIEHIITPYIQNDEKAEIDKRLRANGGKPIESQLESIARYGESENPEETLAQIQREEDEAAERGARENVLTGGY